MRPALPLFSLPMTKSAWPSPEMSATAAVGLPPAGSSVRSQAPNTSRYTQAGGASR